MIERPGKAQSGLVTFRVAERIDREGCQGFAGERLDDHRREYLDYQGAVSGGRGQVERIARGRCLRLEETPAVLEAVCVFEGSQLIEHHFYGRPEGLGRWVFSVRTVPARHEKTG
jgi:hypothetical protein